MCRNGEGMQRIMIVSDTHKRLGNLYEAVDKEGQLDLMIHLGDSEGDEDVIRELAGCPVYMVSGNNDFYSLEEREIETDIGGKHVFLTHGHYYYVSLDLRTIKDEALGRGADIVMFGHTHRPVIEVEENLTLINPGSISYPRQADRKCTYIMMEVDDTGAISYELKSV
jgi:hypothetical protein